MIRIQWALWLMALLLSTSVPAEASSPNAPRAPAQSLHPFYLNMNFVGGVFHDPKNRDCGTGFIGWVQHNENPPELIYIDDVFRRVKMNCTKADFKKSNISCLSQHEITFSHRAKGHTYRAILRMTNKDIKHPTFQLQRLVDNRRILLCNFKKVI